jgi:hypothetical protein
MSGLPAVGLVRACDDPDLFNFQLYPRQRKLLEAVERGPRIHCWALGRRSGKSAMCALVGLWHATLCPHLNARVRSRERRHVVAVATSKNQARLVLNAARSVVAGSKLLQPLLIGESEDELEFSTGASFHAFPCTARSGRGWAISALLCDELAHFVDNQGSNTAAESVWNALAPGCLQFGADARIIASSTPWGSDGLFADLHREAAAGDLSDAIAQHATTQQMNPTIDPEWLAAEERRDPVSFRSEYLATFEGSGGVFFDADTLQSAVTLPGELRPQDATDWIAGCDPAFSHDPFALVLVGRDKRDRDRLLVGAVRSWVPAARKTPSLDERRVVEDTVLDEVAQVIKLYGARAVTDQFRSSGVTDRLKKKGITVQPESMTSAMKDSAFQFLRSRFTEGSVELFEHPGLLRELKSVRTRYAANRSSIVLPRNHAGGHGDLAQALAIAVLAHDQYAPVRSRATFGRAKSSGKIEQGSLSGGNDAAAISRIFGLAPGDVYGGGRDW